jgi:hypothetical protein
MAFSTKNNEVDQSSLVTINTGWPNHVFEMIEESIFETKLNSIEVLWQ